MSEVSCSVLGPVFQSLGRRGIPATRAVEGTPYTVLELRNTRRRIPWDDFTQILARSGALVGSADDLVEMGRESVENVELQSLYATLNFFVTPRAMYAAIARFTGNILFPTIQSQLLESGPRRSVLELRIPDAYAPSEPFLQITRGALGAYPLLIGYPPGRVEAEITPRWARYTIDHAAPARRPTPRRLLHAWRRLRASDQVLEELATQQAILRDGLVKVKEAEAARRASEARWRSLAQNAPDLIFALDRAGRIQYANRVDPSLADQVVGMSLVEFLPEASRHRLEAAIAQVAAGRERVRFEVSWAPPGGDPRYFACTMGPVLEDGATTGFIVVARDVTRARQREAKRQAIEQQLVQTQHLESLGVLSRGVAHDFNNLLTGLAGSAEVALLHLPEDHPARAHVERIVHTSLRASTLTGQLLAYAGQGGLQTRAVDLGDVITSLGDLVRASVPETVTLTSEVTDVPSVQGDPSRLQQVILNLLTNAAEAIGATPGEVAIHAWAETLRRGDDLRGTVFVSPNPGAYVHLSIRDTGEGMDEATQRRIFDPFFTTKGAGRGLGLAAVLGIVRSHRGALSVESGPDEGTTFHVLFPRSARTPDPSPTPVPVRKVSGRPVLLLVEDEAIVRETARELLNQHGFRVITARDGPHAIETFTAHAGEVDVLLIDLTLPGCSGVDVYRAVRTLDRQVPVILTSAYPPSSEGLEPGIPFLHKPWRRRVLLETVTRVLGPPDPTSDGGEPGVG